MKKKFLLLTLTLIAVTGCRTRPLPISYTLTTLPEVGMQATAGVGERLVTQALARSVPVLAIQTDQPIGDYLVLKGRYQQSQQNTEYATFPNVKMRKISDNGNHSNDLFFFEKDKGTKVLCVSRRSCAEVEYITEYATSYSPQSLQQTLLYNGKIGNRITLSYREFSQDLARPAFTNEVAYDLSESKILGYKGARLEVISATNTELTYRVVAGFDAR
ncbi:hypothetical protein [Rugamonas rivuli]|uniref:Lipoprotein n=1 Tax=Rugamonas rivuli TaxID=2743358 RepID=A0A843SFC9_9BURK|nr:hypothetical protein [Rugamonas rivuli]MQA19166.1 hypothetical protein [Rugamonas rivuli]